MHIILFLRLYALLYQQVVSETMLYRMLYYNILTMTPHVVIMNIIHDFLFVK